jgi:hypothetical protein
MSPCVDFREASFMQWLVVLVVKCLIFKCAFTDTAHSIILFNF